MFSFPVVAISLCLLLGPCRSSHVPVNITAKPGEDASLPCRAPNNTDITVAEWTRPELEQDVLMYRDRKPDLHNQHPSYQNRVELKDRDMKDGDVSMILKSVNSNDSGTYECRVFLKETNIRRRSAKYDPISIVHLQVHQPGDKEGGDEGLQIGLGVGLTVAALLVVGGVVGGFMIYRKLPERIIEHQLALMH